MATLTRSPDSGFLTALTVGTVATAYGYNGYGEVESVNTGTLYSEGLQYDPAGRLTVMQESVNGTPTQYTYTYDSVGRLTSATKDGTTTTSWTYDGNGNRLTENGVTSTFDAQDRLLTRGSTSYTWDALGGRKTKTEGGQTTQYTHDGLGALLSVTLPDSTQLTYEYDARQRRVAKRRNGTVEARWVYDGQYRVAAQLDASGSVTHRFVYGSQSHSPDYVVTGGVTYAYVKNHLGSIRFVVNVSTGAVAQQFDYDAWGNVLTDSAPGFQPFAFAGGIYDRDTKLTHFGYRDYDAAAGVWMVKDPIRLRGGSNLYVYCSSDPLTVHDSSGLVGYEDRITWSDLTRWIEAHREREREIREHDEKMKPILEAYEDWWRNRPNEFRNWGPISNAMRFFGNKSAPVCKHYGEAAAAGINERLKSGEGSVRSLWDWQNDDGSARSAVPVPSHDNIRVFDSSGNRIDTLDPWWRIW